MRKRKLKALRTNDLKFPNKAYNNLYYEVDKFMKSINPCKISGGKCARGKSGGTNFCCGAFGTSTGKDCSYCSSTGCKAEKPLACRLWLCRTAESNLNEKQLKQLEYYRKLAGIFANERIAFRATKQDAKKIFEKYHNRSLSSLGYIL